MKLNSTILSTITACALLATGQASFAADKADNTDLIAVKALKGTHWTGKNGNGMPCFDFTMAGHRLRLEDVRVIKHSTGGKISYSGTFTMTNRKRFWYDPHIFVVFNCSEGKVNQLVMKGDRRHGGFLDVVGEFTEDIIKPAGGKKLAKTARKIFKTGDATEAMSTATLQIVGEYAQKSVD